MEIAKPPDIDRIGSLLDEINLISSNIKGVGASNFPDVNKLDFISGDDKLVGLEIVRPREGGYQEVLDGAAEDRLMDSVSGLSHAVCLGLSWLLLHYFSRRVGSGIREEGAWTTLRFERLIWC
ncbi:hypothetical protein LINGRAHAP2_LOCUS3539 [Linum grandiflorum]